MMSTDGWSCLRSFGRASTANPGGDDRNTANDGSNQKAVLKGVDEGGGIECINGNIPGKPGEDCPGNGHTT